MLEDGRMAQPGQAVLLVWHNLDCGTPVSYDREVAAVVGGGDVVEGEVAGRRYSAGRSSESVHQGKGPRLRVRK